MTLDIEQWWMRASAKGISVTTDTIITGIDGTDVLLMHHPTGREDRRQPDFLVLAIQQSPVDELYIACRDANLSVQRVGDCVTPRRAHAAVIDGQRVGESL